MDKKEITIKRIHQVDPKVFTWILLIVNIILFFCGIFILLNTDDLFSTLVAWIIIGISTGLIAYSVYELIINIYEIILPR